MLNGEDIGKKTIVFDTFKKKWEPCDRTLQVIDSSIGMGYMEKEGAQTFRWPLKHIRVIDGY
jgi:hypothetical protein